MSPLFRCQYRRQILIHGTNRGDIEFFNQDIKCGRADKRGQRRAELDILYAQMQQRQKNYNRLLLIPGQHKRQRQVVYAAFEGPCQGDGYLNRGVGVVALAAIEQARYAVDFAEIEFVEPILAAGQREDNAIVGDFLGEFGEVVSSRFCAVAAADEEEMPDFAAFTASMTLPATLITVLRAKPMVMNFAGASSANPGAARAALMTGVKSRSRYE